jgi:hypothetical protein
MATQDQQYLDRLLLEAGGEYGEPCIGLRFIVPREIDREHGDEKRTPGVYLRAQSPNKSPTAKVSHEERLLTQPEAEEWAAMVDRFAGVVKGQLAHRGGPETNVELVRQWYGALGRNLGRAIDAAEHRRMELREAHAQIAGRPYRAASTGQEG